MRTRIAAAALCLAVTARADTPGRAQWPLRAPFVVMNTIATLQYYGKRPGFHHGVDLRAEARSKVYAPVSGVVGVGYYYPRYKIPYTYMFSIDADDGSRWELHHVDPPRSHRPSSSSRRGTDGSRRAPSSRRSTTPRPRRSSGCHPIFTSSSSIARAYATTR